MARRRKMRGEQDKDPGLDISSLIDVSFLLLIYFLVTSTLQPQESDLGFVLPTDAPGSSPIKIDPITIKVTEDGAIYIGDKLVSGDPTDSKLVTLIAEMSEYRTICEATDSQPMVIVSADDGAEQQRFIDVVNALASKEVDIKNITLSGFKDD